MDFVDHVDRSTADVIVVGFERLLVENCLCYCTKASLFCTIPQGLALQTKSVTGHGVMTGREAVDHPV